MAYIGPSKHLQHFDDNTKQTLTPNSVKTVFTLDREVPTASSVRVVYNDIPQEPGVDYTTAGNQITFTFTPATGNGLYVVFLKSQTPVGVPGDSTITEAKLAAGAILKRGHIFGLQLANNGTDATNDIDIAVGECSDSTGVFNMVLSSLLTKKIDATWVAGSGNGGFPSALTLTNDTWYHMFIIKNTTTGVVDAGFDTSITATNLLNTSTYNVYRRIGSVRRETAANKLFKQHKDVIYWNTPPVSTNPATGNLTLLTPPDVECLAAIIAEMIGNANGAAIAAVTLRPTSGSHSINTSGSKAWYSNPTANDDYSTIDVMTNTSSQVYNIDNNTGTSNIYLIGYVDYRGKE